MLRVLDLEYYPGMPVNPPRHGQEEVLSSSWTFFHKYVFTTNWTLGFGLGTLAMFVGPFTDPDGHRWIFLSGFVLGSTFLWATLPRLKRVALRDGALVVSNYRKEIVVPLGDIDRVSQNQWLSWRPITLSLRTETPFGRSIVFMPPFSWALFSEHDVVHRLRKLANQSRTPVR
jgi:hypothetical protein